MRRINFTKTGYCNICHKPMTQKDAHRECVKQLESRGARVKKNRTDTARRNYRAGCLPDFMEE